MVPIGAVMKLRPTHTIPLRPVFAANMPSDIQKANPLTSRTGTTTRNMGVAIASGIDPISGTGIAARKMRTAICAKKLAVRMVIRRSRDSGDCMFTPPRFDGSLPVPSHFTSGAYQSVELVRLDQIVRVLIRSPAIDRKWITGSILVSMMQCNAGVAARYGRRCLIAVMALLPAAIRRYRAMVANLEESGIDLNRAREVPWEMLGEICVRPEPDGIPVAEYALNETPLVAVAGGAHLGVVAGLACGVVCCELPAEDRLLRRWLQSARSERRERGQKFSEGGRSNAPVQRRCDSTVRRIRLSCRSGHYHL
jgi:hypothetical protein